MDGLIREMSVEDWPQMAEIYRQGIETNLATFQVEVPTYEEWDKNYLKNCRYVMLDGDKVVGWVGLYSISSRLAYRGVAELSIYIHNEYKSKGIGKKLLTYLIKESEKQGFWTLQSAIMQNNEASIALHKRCGFREVGYREKMGQDRYGNWRNVILLEKRSQKI